jgi:hypothetical protein
MNEGWRVATHTSFSIFDSYDIKSLNLNLVIVSSMASKWQGLKVGMLVFSTVL